MRIALLVNDDANLAAGSPEDARAVASVHDAARDVASACTTLGHTVVPMIASDDSGELCHALRTARPELVFNLCESVRGDARLEAAVAAILELLGVPFTGSRSRTLALALDKPLTKLVLRGAGLPTPAFVVLDDPDDPTPELRWPVIVKPTREDASHGISAESVCRDAATLRARARYVIETYRQPALVEEFIAGRELNVSVLGTGAEARVLPLGEIDFTHFPAGLPHVVTYEAKWNATSAECLGSPPIAARDLAPELAREVERASLAACRVLGVRGYARVDLRLCAQRGPFVLEVNANPDLGADAGFARAAARAEIDYPRLIARVIAEAFVP